MERVKLGVEVSKETYELCQGVAGVVKSVQRALSDGWQPGQDLPQLLLDSMQHLGPAVQGIEKVSLETQDTEAFVDALYLGLKPAVMSFVKKAPPQA